MLSSRFAGASARNLATLLLGLELVVRLGAAGEPAVYPELTFHAPPKTLPESAVTGEWPHFLGPVYNATTGETRLLQTWPAAGPKRVWEMQSGDGYACPVFAAGNR